MPPAGWQPYAGWPPPPTGWRFWRVPRLRLLATVLLAGIAVLFWFGAIGDMKAWHQHGVLDKRGVTTTATVLSYAYDSDGGDPDGWTIDHVRFTTAAGSTVVTTVGHHAPGPERISRELAVTYDPQHPTLARAAHYLDDADDPANAVIGAVLSLLLTAAAGYLTTRVVTVSQLPPGAKPAT